MAAASCAIRGATAASPSGTSSPTMNCRTSESFPLPATPLASTRPGSEWGARASSRGSDVPLSARRTVGRVAQAQTKAQPRGHRHWRLNEADRLGRLGRSGLAEHDVLLNMTYSHPRSRQPVAISRPSGSLGAAVRARDVPSGRVALLGRDAKRNAAAPAIPALDLNSRQ
jgi:hypothetical protein